METKYNIPSFYVIFTLLENSGYIKIVQKCLVFICKMDYILGLENCKQVLNSHECLVGKYKSI